MPEDNLLRGLHNWVVQDENFTTDAFAHLLRHLLRYEPGVGCELVGRLCEKKWAPAEGDAQAITVRTQVPTEGGRPDMEIRAPGHLAYVEVKLEASLGVHQLKSYRCDLDKSGVANTVLVFLSRYYEEIPEGEEPDASVRWFEVGAWLDEWLEQSRISDPDCTFLTTQFRDYLRGRGMTMERVGYELGKGVASMFNLLEMMGEALEGWWKANYGGWQQLGFRIAKTNYYLYLDLQSPEIVRFLTACKIDQAKADSLSFGHTFLLGGSLRWGHELDLASEEVHFYSLSREAQMKCIEEFAHKCLAAAESITVGEATPVEAPQDSSSQGEGPQ
jgi:hypothetical protein